MAPFGGILAWLPLQDARSTAQILALGCVFYRVIAMVIPTITGL